MKKLVYFLLSLFCMVAFVLTGCGSKETTAPNTPKELLVYSGAGLKSSMEDIRIAFAKAHPGVSVKVVYAGSGQLLTQLEQSGKGDVFIVGSAPTFKAAETKNLTNQGHSIAHHTPCIVVAKGNPKHIQSLADLTQPGLRLALGDEKANAVGLTATQIFNKNNLSDRIQPNVVMRSATVNELFLAIMNNNADATIATKDGAYKNKDNMELIDIPADQNIDQIITAATLKTTSQAKLADEFLAALQTADAKATWQKYGFTPVQ